MSFHLDQVRRTGIIPVMPSFFFLSLPPPSLMFLLPFPLSPNTLLQGQERAREDKNPDLYHFGRL